VSGVPAGGKGRPGGEGPFADRLRSARAASWREPPAPRGDLGVFALVNDSEGNALYLHAAS